MTAAKMWDAVLEFRENYNKGTDEAKAAYEVLNTFLYDDTERKDVVDANGNYMKLGDLFLSLLRRHELIARGDRAGDGFHSEFICGGDYFVDGRGDRLIPVIEGDNNSAVLKNHDASDRTVGFFAIVGNTCIKRQILAGREPNLFFCDKQRNGNRVI